MYFTLCFLYNSKSFFNTFLLCDAQCPDRLKRSVNLSALIKCDLSTENPSKAIKEMCRNFV